MKKNNSSQLVDDIRQLLTECVARAMGNEVANDVVNKLRDKSVEWIYDWYDAGWESWTPGEDTGIVFPRQYRPRFSFMQEESYDKEIKTDKNRITLSVTPNVTFSSQPQNENDTSDNLAGLINNGERYHQYYYEWRRKPKDKYEWHYRAPRPFIDESFIEMTKGGQFVKRLKDVFMSKGIKIK